MVARRGTLVLAAAFVLAAAAFDAPPLYVPGVAFLLLVAGSRLWVGLATRRAWLEPRSGPWTIVEGEPYPLEVVVRAGRLPLPGGRVVHPLAARPRPLAIRPPIRVVLRLPALPRGRCRIDPATLQLTDPLRLHTGERRAAEGDQVLVLPRIEPVVARREGRGEDGDGVLDGVAGVGAAGLDTRPLDFEIDGLRPYRPGSPASRIHWPTVARRREMVERRLVSGADASPLVVLDSAHPASTDALDRAVRAAASLCVYLARWGGCALLLSGERATREIDPQLRGWPQVHACLAVVEGGGPPPAARQASPARVVFWVTAAARPAAGARRLTAPGCFLVTPSPLPGVESEFTVAGCHGQRLGAVWRRTATPETAMP